MDSHEQKALMERKKERDRLFSFKQNELSQLSHADQYARIKFKIEIEGNEYVRLLKFGLNYQEASSQARKKADDMVDNWNENCSIWNMVNNVINLKDRYGNREAIRMEPKE